MWSKFYDICLIISTRKLTPTDHQIWIHWMRGSDITSRPQRWSHYYGAHLLFSSFCHNQSILLLICAGNCTVLFLVWVFQLEMLCLLQMNVSLIAWATLILVLCLTTFGFWWCITVSASVPVFLIGWVIVVILLLYYRWVS